MIPIALVDFGNGTGVSHADMVKVAAAMNVQFQQQFSLPPPYGYGIAANVRVASAYDIRPHEWLAGLFAKADEPGALGYHDVTPTGQPIMKMFPKLDEQDGVPWSMTLSHEIAETLADPNCAKCALSWDGQLWAYEICDAVEEEGYDINGVRVSDFVLPPYFEPVSSLANLKLDWMKKVSQPLQILPGGYGQTFDPQRGWQQVFAQEAAGEKDAMPRHFRMTHPGRRARRIARHQAMLSRRAAAAITETVATEPEVA